MKYLSKMVFPYFIQQTIWLFFRDMIKGIILSIIIGPPVVAAIIVIVQVPLLAYGGNVVVIDPPDLVAAWCTYVSKDFYWFGLQKGGPYLAIYLWGFMFVLSLVMMSIYPTLIAPLFNKFTPVSSIIRFCPASRRNQIPF